jgi:twitching motility protein PilT
MSMNPTSVAMPGGAPSAAKGGQKVQIVDLLKLTVEREASDLHLAVGRPPVMRIDGSLGDVDSPVLDGSETRRLIYGILTDEQKQKLEEDKELDFSLSLSNISRFRVNVHFQRGTVAAAFRAIPSTIRNFQELSLPKDIVERLARRPNGFVLVTGPTGSGKSTTLAAIIDFINSERQCHIITIEDPIEYLHKHKLALVEQREVHEDTRSFASALKYAMRQDPDVLMVGEMRDMETIQAALTAAETGHLVFSTLHTVDVAQTVDRIIDVFPPHQQEQVRVQLAGVLEGILSQKLLPAIYSGRCIALEVFIATDAMRALVREGQTHQIPGMIEAGQKHGMVTMDRAITDLFRRGKISREMALQNCRKPDEVKRQLG